MIGLAAHIRGTDDKDAAAFLADQYGLTSTVQNSTVSKERATAPQAPRQEPTCPTLDYLQHDHEAVDAVGFDPETAKALGIGYAAKGLMRGTVAIPVRLADGTLAGYVGVTECKMPPKWQLGTNVVKLKTA